MYFKKKKKKKMYPKCMHVQVVYKTSPCLLIYIYIYIKLSCVCPYMSEVIHLLVVMGWAGNSGDPLGGPEHPGHVGSGAPACPNTQPCGLCE